MTYDLSLHLSIDIESLWDKATGIWLLLRCLHTLYSYWDVQACLSMPGQTVCVYVQTRDTQLFNKYLNNFIPQFTCPVLDEIPNRSYPVYRCSSFSNSFFLFIMENFFEARGLYVCDALYLTEFISHLMSHFQMVLVQLTMWLDSRCNSFFKRKNPVNCNRVIT